MKIGIDISQLVYEETGVAEYLSQLVKHLMIIDDKNTYVFFGSSLRKKHILERFAKQFDYSNNRTKPISKLFSLPPALLNILWNKLHIFPIEWFIGDIDVFITSDWTEPPTQKAKKATILYDLVVYKYPGETAKSIINTQKLKLKWVKKESDIVFCISESTKKDAMEVLGIEEKRLQVIYPGM